MIKITITKTPTIRLFDRMPLPRQKVRSLVIPRRKLSLSSYSTTPFQRKISKIQ